MKEKLIARRIKKGFNRAESTALLDQNTMPPRLNVWRGGVKYGIRPKPCPEFPLRARIVFESGFATFNTPEEALEYLDHPDRVQTSAIIYREWAQRADQRAKDQGVA